MRSIHLLALLPLVLAVPAQAASGNSRVLTGSAQASVVRPVTMTNTAALRFGQIARPATAGTVTISPAGTISSGGGAAGNATIAQTAGGPAPGTFQITAYPGAQFAVFGPASFNIRNGPRSMAVTLLTGSLQLLSSTSTSETWRLDVGGTLNLGANQAVGTYSGSYTLITQYQ